MSRVVNVPLCAVTKAVQLHFFPQNEWGGWGGYVKFTHLKLHNTFQDVATFWDLKRLKQDIVKGLVKQHETEMQQLCCFAECRRQNKSRLMTKGGVMASTLPGNRRYVSTRWLLPVSNCSNMMHFSHTHACTLQIMGPNTNSLKKAKYILYIIFNIKSNDLN